MSGIETVEYRRFDDVPNGVVVADKFGRVYTKHSSGHATEHGYFNDDGLYHWEFDDTRDYYKADEDELDDCDMWDAWPFYPLPHVKPMSLT